ncbi:uncharacterized protein [Leptinotarsa decemlineata]|uniref:uncharacterized protein n=1 Tax=Leptinotarsa decemlineata TaxID=7539 RepID=UPI003D30C528
MEEPELSRRNASRKSKRNSRLVSFISYFKTEDIADSLISAPTDFEKKEFFPESVSPHVSIQECPFDVTGYGCLIMKDKFELKFAVQQKKKKNVVVFMFEKIIVFTREKETDVFYYLGSINTEDLTLSPSSSEKPTKLVLVDFKKSKMTNSEVEYRLKSKRKEVADAWKKAIEKCLWKELMMKRDNTFERYRSLQQTPDFRDPLVEL